MTQFEGIDRLCYSGMAEGAWSIRFCFCGRRSCQEREIGIEMAEKGFCTGMSSRKGWGRAFRRGSDRQLNFMDYIPVCSPRNTWDADQQGFVTVHVQNRGIYNRIAQKLFGRPKISHIRLDLYGSYVWQMMNDSRTVFDLSKLVKEQFGAEAEPLTERLVQFIQILYQNQLIGYMQNNSSMQQPLDQSSGL